MIKQMLLKAMNEVHPIMSFNAWLVDNYGVTLDYWDNNYSSDSQDETYGYYEDYVNSNSPVVIKIGEGAYFIYKQTNGNYQVHDNHGMVRLLYSTNELLIFFGVC